ncbi:diadenylate cyclase CdaA [Anaerovorax odorimutans]|uniref:diadenylate cyclase CdaA n=1 Tax=Anaerovorax odorimutans TaxID=109327 RepID=UPI0004274F8A|nr:diadenylate cyclase CdaA [Anaerovorax odorimutans]
MSDILNNIVSTVGIFDVIDIAIVSFIVYKILGFIRETRAEQLVKGLLILVIAFFVSDLFHMNALNYILNKTMTLGVLALVVVFQPELRRGLEYVGRSKFVKPQFNNLDKEHAKFITSEIIKAVDCFSTNKVGALMILEREISLNDIAENGTTLNASISKELLGNIFYEGAPLHDGAAILRGDIILAAGCVLPLTQNKTLSKELGTRHRAGIGITENSDAIALIVSEETGIISIAIDGNLSRFLDLKTVEKTLLNLYLSNPKEEKEKPSFLNLFRRNNEDAKE